MSKIVQMNEALYQYLWWSMDREPEVLQRLRAETAQLPHAMMQIAPDQGQFMALLAKLMGARQAIEVGTFTGYSALSIALAMGPGSRMVCCDVSEEWTAIARRYWREAGVDARIELHLQPALATLDALLAEGEEGSYDLMFIDADKSNYPLYYERGLQLLRRGGLLLIDNVLWGGAVIDDSKQDEDTRAIRQLNADLQHDARVELAMLPVGDGLSLVLKR